MTLTDSQKTPAVGIIAEYNPFHNGHAYQIKKAKELSGADFCIVAMSGDFVQRGAPAIFDKYTRTRMALSAGADLVLELPPYFATSSAEDFAACGVALLDHLGVVTHLCFGSECGDTGQLMNIARLLADETPEFSALIKDLLKQGLSYPQAREQALLQYGDLDAGHDASDPGGCPASILASPNNILGIEYCKAILRRGCSMVPITVRRIGKAYHDHTLSEESSFLEFSSATAIRQTLRQQPASPDLHSHVPEQVWNLMQNARPLFSDDFSSLLSYRLLELQQRHVPLEQFLDVSSDLGDRIQKQLLDFSPYEEKISQLKTRQFTYTRISRCLTHILLNMTDAEYQSRKCSDYLSYLRVLGFRRESAGILTEIKKNCDLPLITKTADAYKRLTPEAYEEFTHDIFCSHLYQSVREHKYGEASRNEFTQPVVIL